MKHKSGLIWLSLFLLDAALELFAQWQGWYDVALFTKPLLMPTLILYFAKSKDKISFSGGLIIFALLFSWFGDIFLMFQSDTEIMFLFGLVSFLFAHIMYLWAFQLLSDSKRRNPIQFAISASLVIYAILLALLLWPGLGNMEIPVVIYAAVISCMGISAVFRNGPGYNLVLLGALSFIASDSILAYNKFFMAIEHGGVYIMATYLLGQLLIVMGSLKFINANNS
jgi:uncharacterized membrane protein YhhN